MAADTPEANEMVVGIMASSPKAEGKMISARTKAALARRMPAARCLDGQRTLRTKM